MSPEHVVTGKVSGPQKCNQHQRKSHYDEPASTTPTPMCAQTINGQNEVKHPREYGKDLFGIVPPKPSKTGRGPHDTSRNAKCQQHQTKRSCTGCELINRGQCRESVKDGAESFQSE